MSHEVIVDNTAGSATFISQPGSAQIVTVADDRPPAELAIRNGDEPIEIHQPTTVKSQLVLQTSGPYVLYGVVLPAGVTTPPPDTPNGALIFQRKA